MPTTTQLNPARTARQTANRTVADRLRDPVEDVARYRSLYPDDAPRVESAVVSAETFRYLEIGQRAIDIARQATPDGAGNQTAEIRLSNGRSYARMRSARSTNPSSTYERALAAATHGGGNCGEYASMTFAALVAAGVDQPIRRGYLKGDDHAFTVIGDDRAPGPFVVVDAWTTVSRVTTPDRAQYWAPKVIPFVETDRWNDTRPHAAWDLSAITPNPMSQEQARRIVGTPEGTSTWEHLLASNERRPWMCGAAFATDNCGLYAFHTAE